MCSCRALQTQLWLSLRYGRAQLSLDDTDTITSATLDVVLTRAISDGSNLVVRGLLVDSEYADDDDAYLDYCVSLHSAQAAFYLNPLETNPLPTPTTPIAIPQ